MLAPFVVAAADVEVGSFSKSTVTGAQVVSHGLGSTPKGLILWTNDQLAGVTGPGARMAIGLSDGTTSRAVASASQHAAASANTSVGLYARALAVLRWGEVTDAEADLLSWDATSFTLNWITNDGTPANVHYLIIGGAAQCRVVDWAMPNAPPATVAVTGVGFRPDAVLSIHGGSSNVALGLATSAVLGVTAMDSSGGQWASGSRSYDAAATTGTGAHRFQSAARSLVLGNGSGLYEQAQWQSMDADGFSMRFTAGIAGNTGRVFSLALANVDARAGALLKATAAAPAIQDVSVGFTPGAVLLKSDQTTTQAGVTAHDRSGLGAADGFNQGCAAAQNTDGVSPSQATGVDSVSATFDKVDSDGGVVAAEATLTMIDGGFRLRWTPNDAVATEIGFLAIAVRGPDGGLDAGPPDAGPPDAGPPDAGPPDAGPPDAGPPDAGPPDAGPSDAGPPDAGPPDAGPPDAGGPDAGAPDAGNPDAGNPDAGNPDAGSPSDDGGSSGPLERQVGCDCSAAPLGWLGVALLFYPRRRRAQRGA